MGKNKDKEKQYGFADAKTVQMPRLAGRNALREASADDLRVLLCLLEREGACRAEQLSDDAGCSAGRVAASLEYWEECGVLTKDDGEAEMSKTQDDGEKKKPLRRRSELSAMTGEETAEVIHRRKLQLLIDEAERLYGKVFSTAEIGVIAGLSEQLELEDAYILTLFSFCKRQGKLSLRYAEKTAFALFEEGIDTLGALEAHIERRERAKSGIWQMRRLFGLGERALTKREEECFIRWLSDFGYGEDIIGIAYDITVNTTGKASVAYVDKIISKWHAAACRSVRDVEAYIEREKSSISQKKAAEKEKAADSRQKRGSFDTDEFFARALERSYGKKK